jgi:ubiquinone/menaquinone biosynthesis C-methylase UbiE
MSIKQILDYSALYEFWNSIIGAKRAYRLYVKKYICPKPGDKILDIGCGTADIIDSLPDVDYTGFDLNRDYIDSAVKRFGKRGNFLCRGVSREMANELSQYDIVLATGVLHHLDDNEAIELLELARSVLKPTGRLITLDGCYIEGQSIISRYLLSIDRGKYVRTQQEYLNLASSIFPNPKGYVHHDLLRIPFTHIVMECSM